MNKGTRSKLSVVRPMIMNKGSPPEHMERNIKNKSCDKLELLKTFKRCLEVEDPR